MMGGSALVSPDSTPVFGNLQLYRDEAVPYLRALSDDVHEQGAAVMTQLTHMGHRTDNYTHDWIPALSASGTREPAHRAFTRIADAQDLRRIAQDFADAAARCKEGGLDGVEISAWAGHLLEEFLTPALNHREDEYGGSMENRVRFPLEVIAAVRAAVGDDFVVGMRMSFDEQRAGRGRDRARRGDPDRRRVHPRRHRLLQRRPRPGRHRHPAGAGHPAHGDAREPAPGVRGLGAQAGGRARHARGPDRRRRDRPPRRRRGPRRPRRHDPGAHGRSRTCRRKVAAGHEDRIRPCVGASMCLDSIYSLGLGGLHPQPGDRSRAGAAAAGDPGRRRAKRCVVVGGGPAGLEAARVLAERGHP